MFLISCLHRGGAEGGWGWDGKWTFITTQRKELFVLSVWEQNVPITEELEQVLCLGCAYATGQHPDWCGQTDPADRPLQRLHHCRSSLFALFALLREQLCFEVLPRSLRLSPPRPLPDFSESHSTEPVARRSLPSSGWGPILGALFPECFTSFHIGPVCLAGALGRASPTLMCIGMQITWS